MRLFFTDRTFIVEGLPRPGVPFLCNRRMELVDAPNRYLRYIATVRGRSRAPATWRTYADHLLEFFSFLEDNNFSWTEITIRIMATWRDSMVERQCKRTTVNQRLRCVRSFYSWATQQGLVSEVPFSTQDVQVSRSGAPVTHRHLHGNRIPANELTLRAIDPQPQFLRLENAVRVLEALTPSRARLMGYLMLLTGMRREEVVGLDYRVLPNPAGNVPGRALPMLLDGRITPTKGSRPRTVMVPFDLAVALIDYLTFERHPLQRQYTQRYDRETTRLFLSSRGEELSVKSLNHAFAQATQRSGIQCHPHLLRHTFGTYELLRMQRTHGDSQALLWVRDRMGHSSITTTERYLHSADLIRHDALDGYQQELCEALTHGHTPNQT